MSILDTLDKNMPILIVDDFSTMRRVLKNCLRQLGFENVIEAEDGQRALEKIEETDFKLILSDLHMPTMMGVELLRAIRSDSKSKLIPVIIVASETQKEEIEEAAKAGASSHIIKPFSAQVLQSKLEEVFSPKEKKNS